jgi:hypothetical protein
MSSGKHLFKETDVARALRAAQKAKLKDFTLRITPEGLELKSTDSATQPSRVIDADEWKVA